MVKFDRSEIWLANLKDYRKQLDQPVPLVIEGKLTQMVGMTMEAMGCQAPIGSRCFVVGPNDTRIEAEVVGFSGEKLFLMPTGELRGVVPNARVIPSAHV